MSDTLGPGTMIGAYRIEREIGGGGMGTVYEAIEPTIGKRVAIKVMRPAFAEDAQQASRFEREARAANEVRHPAIIDVFAFGKLGDGRLYMVMSLLDGRSLRDEIVERGTIPAREAWAIAREAADALSSAHAASVIHRDLKPDNVFLERIGEAPMRVRVLDFGIAKVHSKADLERLTNTGVPLGTPSYMAPELWWGNAIDARIDQYALGIMLFEMIAGRLPFSADGFMQLVQKHLHEAPPALGCSKAVDAFVAKLLAKKPEDRFPSMRAAISAGDEAFEGHTETGVSTSRSVALDRTVPATPKIAPLDPTVPATPPLGANVAASTRPPSFRRYRLVHALAIVATLGLACAIGYAGEDRYSPKEWYRLSGAPAHYALASFLIAAFFLPMLGARRARTGTPSPGVWWLALFPGLVGASGTWFGWAKVTRFLDQLPLTRRFPVMNEGFYEVGALRFIGLFLSLALLLAASAIPALSGNATSVTVASGHGVRRRESIAFLVGSVVLAFAALRAHAPSGAIVALTLSIALAIGLALPPVHPETAARDELERALASTLAVAFATIIAFARIDARELALWSSQSTRAERVNEIMMTVAERRATTGIALVCIASVIVLETVRVRRLWKHAAMRVPSTPALALGVVVLVALGFDVALHGRFEDARNTLFKNLEGPFGLFARLDPPTAEGLDRKRFAPHRAPTLQVTRDVVALDGVGIAKIAALDSPETTISLAGALGRAIAQTASDPQPDDRDLAVAIDREVRWKTVTLLLGLAHRSGARRLELRFTRGPRPTLPASGPPEVNWVLPSDFVAVDVAVLPNGLAPNPETAFLEVAPQIVAAAGSGPVAIAP